MWLLIFFKEYINKYEIIFKLMLLFFFKISIFLDFLVIHVVNKRIAIPRFLSKIFTGIFVISNVILSLELFVSSISFLQYLAFLACIFDVIYISMALLFIWVWPKKKIYFPTLIVLTAFSGIDASIKIFVGVDCYVLKSYWFNGLIFKI